MATIEEGVMLDKLRVDDFSRHVNEPFSLPLEGMDSLALELVEVAPVGAPPADGSLRQAFSIIFRGPGQPVLPQQIYSVTHPTLGTLSLFLVPLGPDRSGGIRYEAVFT